MSQRPLIGITMRLEMPTRRFYLGRDYASSIERCGGVPVHIALIPERGYIQAALEALDGILLPGSDTDVDPANYGEEPHPKLKTVVAEKDLTDRIVIDLAAELGLPIFGICYGMQAINVAGGGSLIQDIASQVTDPVKHDQGEPYDRLSHSIRFEAESRFGRVASRLSDNGVLRVNSSHHQAVKSVGDGLVATAWSADGVVEAIENAAEGRFVMGVQWHPEITFEGDELSRAIFEAFVAECSVTRDVKLNNRN